MVFTASGKEEMMPRGTARLAQHPEETEHQHPSSAEPEGARAAGTGGCTRTCPAPPPPPPGHGPSQPARGHTMVVHGLMITSPRPPVPRSSAQEPGSRKRCRRRQTAADTFVQKDFRAGSRQQLYEYPKRITSALALGISGGSIERHRI